MTGISICLVASATMFERLVFGLNVEIESKRIMQETPTKAPTEAPTEAITDPSAEVIIDSSATPLWVPQVYHAFTEVMHHGEKYVNKWYAYATDEPRYHTGDDWSTPWVPTEYAGWVPPTQAPTEAPTEAPTDPEDPCIRHLGTHPCRVSLVTPSSYCRHFCVPLPGQTLCRCSNSNICVREGECSDPPTDGVECPSRQLETNSEESAEDRTLQEVKPDATVSYSHP